MVGERAASSDPLGWVGETIDGRYRVESAVGEGGFGVVYRAHHLKLQEPVALKFLKLGSELTGPVRDRFLETFLAEGKILRRLSRSTSGIVQALDAGDAVSPTGVWSPYLVIEWLDGMSLADDLSRRLTTGAAARSLADGVTLLEPAVKAVDVAHAQGIAHRDLKPENLFLAHVGGAWTLKVLDFGVAKVMGDVGQMSAATAATGFAPRAFSPAYAAPEQFEPVLGATGPWTDVYALALVLLEVTSGRRPYAGETSDSLRREAVNPEARPSFGRLGVPASEAVERVMSRALAVDPRNRYASAGLFWSQLQLALSSAHLAARAPNATAPASTPAPRQRAPDPRPSAFAATPPTPSPPEGRVRLETQAPRSGVSGPAPRTRARRLVMAGAALPLLGAAVFGLAIASKPRAEPANMVLIPSGTYRLGSPSGNARNCEGPRVVDGRRFLIDKTEVTVREYRECQQAGACTSTREHAKENAKWKGLELCNELRADRENVDDHPMNCVDRAQAAAYCLYVHKRLPTDDEWERAARGPEANEFPWGNDPPTCELAVFQRGPAHAVRDRCPGLEGTAPIRSRPPSKAFGLFDVAGNVWEWTSTGCPTAVAHGTQAGSGARPTPAPPQSAQEAELARLLAKAQGADNEGGTLRGGGHEWREENLRAWKRLPWPSEGAGVSTGFRCATDDR